MTPDNRALGEMVEKLPRWDLEWEWMAECDDGDYIKRADVLAILERPVVVGISVTPSEYLLDLVTDVIRHHRLSLSQDEDGQGYPLIDALSCDHKTVAEGIKECEYLADAIVGELPLVEIESMVRGKS